MGQTETNIGSLRFAFELMLAAKLLYNFPPPGGDQVAQSALRELEPMMDSRLSAAKDALLGVCCGKELSIVPWDGRGKWVYSGEMICGTSPDIQVEIAQGKEAHLHKASIDLCFHNYNDRTRRFFGLAHQGEFALIGLIGITSFLKGVQENGASALIPNLMAAVNGTNGMMSVLTKE